MHCVAKWYTRQHEPLLFLKTIRCCTRTRIVFDELLYCATDWLFVRVYIELQSSKAYTSYTYLLSSDKTAKIDIWSPPLLGTESNTRTIRWYSSNDLFKAHALSTVLVCYLTHQKHGWGYTQALLKLVAKPVKYCPGKLKPSSRQPAAKHHLLPVCNPDSALTLSGENTAQAAKALSIHTELPCNTQRFHTGNGKFQCHVLRPFHLRRLSGMALRFPTPNLNPAMRDDFLWITEDLCSTRYAFVDQSKRHRNRSVRSQKIIRDSCLHEGYSDDVV